MIPETCYDNITEENEGIIAASLLTTGTDLKKPAVGTLASRARQLDWHEIKKSRFIIDLTSQFIEKSHSPDSTKSAAETWEEDLMSELGSTITQLNGSIASLNKSVDALNVKMDTLTSSTIPDINVKLGRLEVHASYIKWLLGIIAATLVAAVVDHFFF